MKIFLHDDKYIVSYNSLLTDINNRTFYYPVFQTLNLYHYFLNFVVTLLSNEPLKLIDSDFNKDELAVLGVYSEVNQKRALPIPLSFKSMEEVVEGLLTSKSKITIFTSGTTGQPKAVVHSVSTLTRSIRKIDKYNPHIWAFAYNPTHIAGIQVLFQAIANVNTIINIFNKNRDFVFNAIEKNKVTHISATPTFYRLLMPFEKSYPLIQRVTLGGEKSNPNLYKSISKIFPNAKINNIYASTEAGSLFASKGEYFQIPETIINKIKVVNDELLIHKSLLGLSESFKFKDDFYQTGDLIEWIDQNKGMFKFKSRKNELINVGGYKVNPLEVEEAILSIEEVLQCIVYGKPNSVLGNILCSEIKTEPNSMLNELSIRKQLVDKLQDFKIPRKILFVKEFTFTRTGKIKRT